MDDHPSSSRTDKFTVIMKFFVYILSLLVTIIPVAGVALANQATFVDGQGDWTVTNYGNSNDAVSIVQVGDGADKGVEIDSESPMIVANDLTPAETGVFQFKMRHNKSGVFYFNALTSDEGGQLLFSIQFTEAKGVLLEEANKQIVLLSDYQANEWYLFDIDFDNKRGEHGTLKIKINGESYGEYEYVDSQSTVFDLASIVFGSDGKGDALSAFSDIVQPPAEVPISLTSALEEGQTVTVSIDGVVTPNIPAETPAPETQNAISEEKSIEAPLDGTSTSTITATIDGEVPDTATSTEEETVTAPLDESDTSTNTTTTF